jgi:hypothetical protein
MLSLLKHFLSSHIVHQIPETEFSMKAHSCWTSLETYYFGNKVHFTYTWYAGIWRIGDVAPLILKLGIRWKTVVTLTFQPRYHSGSPFDTHLIGGLVGCSTFLFCGTEIFVTSTGIQTPDHPSPSLVTTCIWITSLRHLHEGTADLVGLLKNNILPLATLCQSPLSRFVSKSQEQDLDFLLRQASRLPSGM